MSDDEIIAVVQAHKEGKQIEYKIRGSESHVWLSSVAPAWNFYDYDYRVKPEPRKLREWWIHKGGYGGEDQRWTIEDKPLVPCCDYIHVREVIDD